MICSDNTVKLKPYRSVLLFTKKNIVHTLSKLFCELLIFECVVVLINCETTPCANMAPNKIWQLN